jgi:PucR C-terminal helix-turn-helix domain
LTAASPPILRIDLVSRLRVRRAEIESAILTRSHSITDPTEVGDPAYIDGLRRTVGAGLEYGLAGIEAAEARPVAIPAQLFVQARHAARSGVSLDTVLRRYLAGYTLLGDFLMQEAEAADFLGREEFRRLMKTHSARFDRLLETIAAEYESEASRRAPSPERRRADCVERLLAGELVDTSLLAYDLDAWHLGVIAVGPGGEDVLRSLAASLQRRLLVVRRDQEIAWAWIGGGHPFDSEEIDGATAFDPPPDACLSIGEPAHGLDGWRFTHRQASAALPVALPGTQPITRYADVALLSSMLQDEVLVRSLNELYLEALNADRNGGQTLRRTLQAYFAAERNVSSAAAALGVTRNTITNRLRAVEERVGRPLSTCGAEIEAALRVEELRGFP